MTKDEALKLALDALEGVLDNSPKVLDASISGGLYEVVQCREAITAIKEALAQPEQEPVGLIESLKDAQPCCGEYQTCWRACTPRGKFLAQRTWVGLTRMELIKCGVLPFGMSYELYQAIEAKLKEKNT